MSKLLKFCECILFENTDKVLSKQGIRPQIIQREILFIISVCVSNLYATNIRNYDFSSSAIFKMQVEFPPKRLVFIYWIPTDIMNIFDFVYLFVFLCNLMKSGSDTLVFLPCRSPSSDRACPIVGQKNHTNN
jgi:hypothetical protein